MEENKNPFTKNDLDKEIENIINEEPLSIPNSQKKGKFKKGGIIKKIKLPNKKIIIYFIITIAILISLFVILNSPCDCSNNLSECIQTQNDNTEFISHIKQQIINKGYAEITDGSSILKVAPYTQ